MKNQLNRNSIKRLKNWDYSSDAKYFVTFCSKNRISYFGHIQKGQILLSEVGVIAYVLWKELKFRIPGLIPHDFVIMPNHIHGIIEYKSICCQAVGATHVSPLRRSNDNQKSPNLSPLSKHIGSYKAAVSKYASLLGFEMAWQRGFYDRLIREDREFYAIRQYIRNNPSKWEEDEYHSSSDI